MAQRDDLPEPETREEAIAAAPRRRQGRWIVAGISGLLVLGIGYVWVTRNAIADRTIAARLDDLGLPARYKVVSIGPEEQVLRDVVIGDPARPDLTIAEVRVRTRLGFGLPGIGRITLVRPRLYGEVRGGKPSFGSLDKLLFTGGTEPFRLPELDLGIEDGRALLETDAGRVGVKLDGGGALRDGFAGTIAAMAPGLAHADCRAEQASLYGRLRVADEKPRFTGPLRLAGLTCADRQARVGAADVQLDVTFDQPLDGGTGTVGLAVRDVAYAGNRMASLGGQTSLTYRRNALNARYRLNAGGAVTPQARIAALTLDGRLRSAAAFARVEVEAEVTGQGLAGGQALAERLRTAETASADTLLAPLITKLRGALARHERGNRLAANLTLRRVPGETTLVVPQASVQSAVGTPLLALSRLQLLQRGTRVPNITGNFTTGGEDLPAIAGRMERGGDGRLTLRVRMDEYAAGAARLAVPELAVAQAPGGALGLAGTARLSGPLPGGAAENLVLPIDATVSPSGDMALWRRCVTVRFDALAFANLRLDKRALPVCPVRGQPVVRLADGILRVAGGVAALDLTGRLGSTPIAIASGPVGFAWPGTLAARGVDVRLGPAATASRFRIANLTARVGSDIAGRFDGSDISLFAVPLDLKDTTGLWRYAGGVLTLGDAAFRLEDRQDVDRFAPLVARGGTLTLRDNLITAQATMREPGSDRVVVSTDIRHDLATGTGHADLDVPGIVFDAALQPDTLTPLALGVIANAQGAVRGGGRIDWTPKGVTSTGRFTTDSLDFAAAFGPVKGTAGTIEFTDLLGLVTAPGQQFRVASINPGIEANDGVLTFALRPGFVLDVDGGSWPFMGGTLRLKPVRMTLGVEETRRYTLEVEGLDAARFVERMEMANLSATGIFDGQMPLIFDKNGGRIEGGMLASRPPGGNVSYVGELTYKDLSAMANFAFDTLRSLDYQRMTIGMDGALEGEIVTRVRFSGVSQGEGAKSNFLTRKIAGLPIQFNVNLRAPFFQLLSSFKSLYDPAYVRDPRELGLIDAQGRRMSKPIPIPPATLGSSQAPPVQPPESEPLP